MSSPAVSWSRTNADTASVYCSRKAEFTIASTKVRRPRFSVYHAGRGSDPVTVVGMVSPAVALYIEALRWWGGTGAIMPETKRRRQGRRRSRNRTPGLLPSAVVDRVFIGRPRRHQAPVARPGVGVVEPLTRVALG